MPAFLSLTLRQLLAADEATILNQLSLSYAHSGFITQYTQQTLTWEQDLHRLRAALLTVVQRRPEAAGWTVIFENEIPRKPKRIDVVLLSGQEVVLLECKRSIDSREAAEQVEEYALLLHYFHKQSHRRHILPLIVATEVRANLRQASQEEAQQQHLQFETLPSFWISPPQFLPWVELADRLCNLPGDPASCPLNATDWLASAYHPVPTIVEAARDLRDGLKIRDIALSEASEHDIEQVTGSVQAIIENAEKNGRHAICFITGVPGSGKTLVGLSLAHLGPDQSDAIHFMSGNGPLVMVLQENFRRQSMREKVPSTKARVLAQTLIENVHVFARTYTDDPQQRAPSSHVVIFDEAQHAWNMAQNLAKFKRAYSEPEMLLRIMERHEDWSVVIALVGGGQEINSGEAGLEEWGRALSQAQKPWQVHASPEVLAGGASTAGRRLFAGPTAAQTTIVRNDLLHLRTSNRSLRAEDLAGWVNAVLDGDSDKASAFQISRRYPVFLSRSLAQTRHALRAQAIASRYGLVGSSKGARLRAEGLEPDFSFHAEYRWDHWYLSGPNDVRSSYQLEVLATEFEIQGLELDWGGLCWGGDFIRSADGWVARDFRPSAPSRWTIVTNEERRMYRRNAYRVLLTRARQGMVVFVPAGDPGDTTRDPAELDGVADFLSRCGAVAL